MIISMTRRPKVAVSLPPEVLAAARAALAAGHAANLSAYVADALEEKVKLDALADLLDEMLAESGGPLTPAERAEIDRRAGWAKP